MIPSAIQPSIQVPLCCIQFTLECVCVCVFDCVCVCVCVCVCLCAHACMCVCVCVCMCVHSCMRACMCICVCMHVCMSVVFLGTFPTVPRRRAGHGARLWHQSPGLHQGTAAHACGACQLRSASASPGGPHQRWQAHPCWASLAGGGTHDLRPST